MPNTGTELFAKRFYLVTRLVQEMGKIEGRTRFQKLIFIIQNDFNVPPLFDFRKYHYGPYADEFADFLYELVALGVIKESKEEIDDEVKQYVYELSETFRFYDQHFKLPDAFKDQVDLAIKKLKGKYQAVSLAGLKSHAYDIISKQDTQRDTR